MKDWHKTTFLMATSLALSASLGFGDAKKNAAKQRTLKLPKRPFNYSKPNLPPHTLTGLAQVLDNNPEDNLLTDHGATLGRVLFYDPRLSGNGRSSCGSCHIQARAFADTGRVSFGFKGQASDRNTMSLVNLRYNRAGFFWDERARTIEEAVVLPIHHRREMGQSSEGLVKALSQDPRYPKLFKAAFGDAEITEDKAAKALAQFLRSMVSLDSKFDKGAAMVSSMDQPFPNFSDAENHGKALFVKRCSACHHIGENDHMAFFSMFRSLNNGLDEGPEARDGGRGDVTYNPSDVGLFKASTLRNVAVTAPYMHDGRLASLEAVMEHYSSGVHRHPTVSPAAPRMLLSQADKAGLIAFLKTLTDENFLNDPRFSDPWQGGQAPINRAKTSTAKPKVQKAPAMSIQERLKRGLGLKPGEALVWLKSLDCDEDQALSQEELKPLLKVLVKTGVRLRLGGFRERRRRPRRLTTSQTVKPGALGDFNGDGQVTAEEASAFARMKRVTELGAGGAVNVILDRFLRGYRLKIKQQLAVRRLLTSFKDSLQKRSGKLDAGLIDALKSCLGEKSFALYKEAVIARASRGGQTRGDKAQRSAFARRQLNRFDRDRDQILNSREQASLAHAMDSLAGGFGQEAACEIGKSQFTRRLLAYGPGQGRPVPVSDIPERMYVLIKHGDKNQDALLDKAELEAHTRDIAFKTLIESGIYIGGAFANTLQETAIVLDEIGLDKATIGEARALIIKHGQSLDELREQTTRAVYPQFRELVNEAISKPRRNREMKPHQRAGEKTSSANRRWSQRNQPQIKQAQKQ